jgi:hypothetical protein
MLAAVLPIFDALNNLDIGVIQKSVPYWPNMASLAALLKHPLHPLCTFWEGFDHIQIILSNSAEKSI